MISPLTELLKQNSVWKPLSANSDAFKDTIATKLIKHQMGHYFSNFLFMVGNNAANKVGIGCFQGCHQGRQLLLWTEYELTLYMHMTITRTWIHFPHEQITALKLSLLGHTSQIPNESLIKMGGTSIIKPFYILEPILKNNAIKPLA